MYGISGTIRATEGSGDELAARLQDAAAVVAGLPGCHLYLVSRVDGEPDTVHVFEAWDDADAHAASLEREEVRAVIAAALPVIAGMGERQVLEVAGGHGLGA